tara:strand:- start:428 stop:736 length:309 start_codon:yes stop_codon:yes gene_type:complete
MTAKQMIELIQQHHPHIGETEALLLLNEVKDEFCENTEITKTLSTGLTTTAGQLLYDISLGPDSGSAGILKINKVWVGDGGTGNSGILTQRLQGTLKLKDLV